MTKIPILLSILSLMGNEIAVPSTVGLETTTQTYAMGSISAIANQNVAGLKFTQLNFATGQLEWEFQYQDEENRTFSRFVMTSLNFMNGVTEAEADQKLATLGNSEWEDWVDWRTDFVAPDNRYAKGTKLYASLAWGDPLHMNRSDLIYYAVQYKNWDDPSVEPVWYRGKLDYRGCAHDPNIESGYELACQISLDPITNQYLFTPNGGTLSYDEEIAEIARESYLDAVRQQVEDLERRKLKGDEGYRNGISGVEYSFGIAKQQIEIMHATERLASDIADLEQRIARLKQEESSQPSTDEDDDSISDDKEDTDREQNDFSRTDVNSQTPNDVIVAREGKSLTENGGAIGLVASNENATDDNQANDAATNEIDDRSNLNDPSSDVEVPNLGDEEPWLKRHLWVLLLPVAAITFLIIVLAKKRREEDDEL